MPGFCCLLFVMLVQLALCGSRVYEEGFCLYLQPSGQWMTSQGLAASGCIVVEGKSWHCSNLFQRRSVIQGI